jgi:hypothetical protein
MRRRGSVFGTAVAAGLLLAACGGGGGGDHATRSNPAAEEGDDGGGGGADATCGDLGTAWSTSAELNASIFSGDPADLRDQIDEALEQWPDPEVMRSSVPPEIADDYVMVMDSTRQMFEALAAADSSDPASRAAALAGVDMGPEVQAAAQRVAAYFQEHCGIDIPTG